MYTLLYIIIRLQLLQRRKYAFLFLKNTLPYKMLLQFKYIDISRTNDILLFIIIRLSTSHNAKQKVCFSFKNTSLKEYLSGLNWPDQH